MKRTWKAAVVLMLLASVFMIVSCDSMLTNSTMKKAARDPEKAAKALAKKPTNELVANAGEVADKAQAQAIVGALSQKPAEEIKALSNDQKKDVITAASTAVIDMAKTAGSIDFSSLGSDGGDQNQIINSIINNVSATDTTCVSVILTDAIENPNATNPTLKSGIPDDMKSSLAIGAVTVAASTLKGSNFDLDNFMNACNGEGTQATQTVDQQVSAILPGASAAEQANLKTALITLKALNADSSFSFASVFGGGSN